jgi:MSP (Major sperm protein) domain
MTLELIPNNDLVFKGPFTAVSTTALKLSNSGNERLAYKIKTTAPKRYCVKPNSGFLDPRDTASIQGTHQIDCSSIRSYRFVFRFAQ